MVNSDSAEPTRLSGGSCSSCRAESWRADQGPGQRFLSLLFPLERLRCETCGRRRWRPSSRLITLRRSLVWSGLALASGWVAGMLWPDPKGHSARPTVRASAPGPPQASPTSGRDPGDARLLAAEASELALLIPLWAQAWSARSTEEYLAFYSPDFTPPGAGSREVWEADRRQRIGEADLIEVKIRAFEVEVLDPPAAVVRFEQDYRSDTFSDQTIKRLQLRRENGRWQIVAEQSLPAGNGPGPTTSGE